MKKFYFFLFMLLGVYSCSYDISSDKIDSENEYIKLEKDHFILTINNVDASTNNISAQEYEEMVEDTKIANEVLQKIIADLKKDPTIKRIYITDKNSNLFYEVYEGLYTSTIVYDISTNVSCVPSLKYRSENPDDIPNGWIETYGSENVSRGGYWAPNGLKGISCYCQAKVAWYATHFVSTKALGSAIVRSRQGNGDISVPLDASHTYFTVSYATTDSNGGRCSWNGYM